ncbi:MAG: dihydrodipicolinate synthase family protein [Isosphaeraceae bacterium]
MTPNPPLRELVAATHAPFLDDGTLNPGVVDRLAEHLQSNGVNAVFINGTTGESHSLTVEERLALADRWCSVVRGTSIRVVVHVGTNCLADARTLAAQAQSLGASAISAHAPAYFRPDSAEMLAACCGQIADAAPETPFYFYDIPSMTGVNVAYPMFLDRAADRMPSFAGVKFTNPDLVAYQRALAWRAGRADLPWGNDETLLAALALGASGAVGSSYNVAAPLYRRLMGAFERGDVGSARAEQLRSVRLVDTLSAFGYMAACRAFLEMQGVPIGPPRLPHRRLDPDQAHRLREALESIGAFGG